MTLTVNTGESISDKLAKFRKIAKKPAHEESKLQQSAVKWFRLQYPQYAMNLFAIPNGGKRGKIEASIMKGEGVVAGVADMMLAIMGKETGVANGTLAKHLRHGLFIEFKTSTGKQSPEQKAFEKAVTCHGYQYEVCRSLEDFMNLINQYLK